MHRRPSWRTALVLLATAALCPTGLAQDGPRIVVEPAQLELQVGETVKLEVHVVDADGTRLEEEVFFFSRGRRAVTVTDEGEVEAIAPGSASIVVRTRRRGSPGEGQEGRAQLGERLTATIPVTILPPPLLELSFSEPDGALYAGTSARLEVSAVDVQGGTRQDPEVRFKSSAPAVASFDSFGQVHLHRMGSFTASAVVEGVRAERTFDVRANPVASLELEADLETARTGDVVHFAVSARDAGGNEVTGVPVLLTFVADPDDQLGPGASGQIEQDGRFVAETPGLYTAVATCGGAAARASVRVVPRGVEGRLELIGRGKVHDVHTSDLWVWEGVDGRDYCVTGTWGANGDAIFWDVTDPANIERIATVTINARTVNDVKVSQDGRTCVLSREGASDRKNGLVIVDVSDPRNPAVVQGYDEQLTGGVHNVFVDGDEVYALSAGRRYDVIDISDPQTPKKVGQYELDTPGHSIHDVWVASGLAFSSNWSNGVHIVDVGNGIRDGSPSNPQYVSHYAYPSGWNHAAFPYRNEQTGRFYVVAGDEAFPFGLHVQDTPTYARGWLHFIDFTDLSSPFEAARYQVPEAGTHNLWIEGDICYAAFYNGGVRVIDISGELMGDLYRQGREIAWFLPTDKEGLIPNSPMVWGPQPHKGHLFFSDWNTGLWCLKLTQADER